MRQIVSALKPFFDRIEDRFDRVETGLAEVKAGLTEVKGVTRRTALQVSKLVGDVADIKRDTTTKVATKEDIRKLRSWILDFSTEVAASRRDRVWVDESFKLHEGRLDEHERRLSRLESRHA